MQEGLSPTGDPTDLPAAVRDDLVGVRSLGVITGAGISAESGIRTYRGPGGLYDDPVEGERTVEALSGGTLRTDPDRTWGAVAALARNACAARPNAAHRAVARMEELVPRFVLLTQNVDGLHRAAGSRNVIDIHGDLLATRCLSCGAGGRLEHAALAALERCPRCPSCDGALRPDAVLFGEMLPEDKVLRIRDAFHRDPPDLVLVVGTTASFPYIAAPVRVAASCGRVTIEVNRVPTDLTPVVRHYLRGRAGTWLPLLADALAARR